MKEIKIMLTLSKNTLLWIGFVIIYALNIAYIYYPYSQFYEIHVGYFINIIYVLAIPSILYLFEFSDLLKFIKQKKFIQSRNKLKPVALLLTIISCAVFAAGIALLGLYMETGHLTWIAFVHPLIRAGIVLWLISWAFVYLFAIKMPYWLSLSGYFFAGMIGFAKNFIFLANSMNAEFTTAIVFQKLLVPFYIGVILSLIPVVYHLFSGHRRKQI